MGRNSFSPETPVWTADGQVPIGNLAVGDTVLGYNETTGATAPYTVTAVWAHADPLVLAVTIDDEVITSTLEHPFYVMLRGWVAAEDLYPGQAVRRVDGSYGVVAAVTPIARHQPMVNLAVAEAHTFFVGDDGWLVHNDGSDFGFGRIRDLRGKSEKWLRRNKPQGWCQVPTRKKEGWRWLDEAGQERFRFMRPKKREPIKWSRERVGYMKWNIWDSNGRRIFLDIDGCLISPDDPEVEWKSHIPYEGPLP